MNRFGLSVYPQESEQVQAIPGNRFENPYHRKNNDGEYDSIRRARMLPDVMYFENENNRNDEMKRLALVHPNVYLVPFEVKRVFRAVGSPKLTEYECSAKGLLPT